MNETAFDERRVWLPEDLREWVAPELLLRYVLEAAQTAAEQGDGVHFALPAGLPRTWLTVLTYSYAAGIYGSEDIEREAGADAALIYAASNTFVSAITLRRFRRAHREHLQRSLGLVLERVWRRHYGALIDEIPGDRDVDRSAAFLQDAQRRINGAVLMDTMALDT